jgi:type I restriction enzyme, S subunit
MRGPTDWMSLIPPHWSRKKLKHVASLKSGDSITSEAITESGEYPVFGGNGIRGYTSAYTHCGKYVLIGRQGALCGNINYASGCFWASEHAVVVDIKGEDEVVWLGELLRSMDLNQYSQSAAQPGIAVDVIGNLEIPVPPLHEQRTIADYLGRETARLDELVAAKEHSLGLLAEKRRALITRAVTRGLDPRAPLRDSGIPWLGEIPVHWEVQRLKFIVPRIEQGWSPECHNVPASDEEWGVLKAGCCNGGVFNQQENKSLPPNLAPPLDLEIKPGDILMSRASGSTELIGSVALVPEGTRSRLLLSDKTYRIRLDTSRAIQSYFVIALGSDVGRVQVQEVISGAAGLANNIAQGDIREFAVPLPPMDEQAAIVDHIAAETAKLDALRLATERTIALLKERRAALIAAAVTGKLDMQGAERDLDVVAD